MKKSFLLAAAFLGMLLLASCSNDEKCYVKSSVDSSSEDYSSKTIEDLEKYNKVLVHNFSATRGVGSGSNRRKARIVAADLNGAVESLDEHHNLTSIALGLIFGGHPHAGGALLAAIAAKGAVPASWNAYKKTCGLAYKTEEIESLFGRTKNYCLESMVLEDNMAYADIDDDISSCIDIPDSLNFLLRAGVAHNQIINLHRQNDRNTEIHRTPKRIPFAPDIEFDYCMQVREAYNSTEFEIGFFDTWGLFDEYDSSTGFDFDSYIEENPYQSSFVTSTITLFVNALDVIPDTDSDLYDTINSYISIIEDNNEFSRDDRYQIYAGLIVAAYSYNLWNGILN